MISDPSTPSPGRRIAAGGAALLLAFAFAASVIVGPQLAVWRSAPALLVLAAAGLLAVGLPSRLPRTVFWSGLALAAWLVFRCVKSPVAEFAVADAMLLASCVVSFWVGRAVFASRGGLEIVFCGLGLLVLANGVPLYFQSRDPGYELWLPRASETFPSGFFSYYGDCAAFLTAMALLAGGLVWDDRRAPWFRIFMGITLLAAVAGVAFTNARGGLIGLGCGGLVLLLVPWLVLRRDSRWRGVVALTLPVLLVGGLLVLGEGLSEAQRVRNDSQTFHQGFFDNQARLFWWRLAGSVIATHPWTGGGSRSFSWENFQFWEADSSASQDIRPEFVHNEILQLTSDYGLIGLSLLMLFLGSLVVIGITSRWSGDEPRSATPLFLGGMAALAGLLVHGLFHFVFHLPPAAMLLGVVLAAVLAPARPAPSPGRLDAWGPGRWVPLACALFLGFLGVKSLPLFRQLAPVVYRFGQVPPGEGETLERVAAAAAAWPGPGLILEQAKLLQRRAEVASGVDRVALLEAAAESFGRVLEAHPYHAEASVNRANVLGGLGRDAEAEAEFERAIRLQGGLRLGFKAHYSASLHRAAKAERLRSGGDLPAAFEALLQARDLFDQGATPAALEFGAEGRAYRSSLSQSLGPWLEGLGRRQEAAAEYDRVALIPHTYAVHFLAARNLMRWGDAVWLERRPETALARFLQARERLKKCGGVLPAGSTPADLAELSRQLDSKIEFLEGAGILPEE